MFWWFTEMNNQTASKLWTAAERRAAIGAWGIAIALMGVIMLPMDYYLIFKLNLNDILSGGVGAGVASGIGLGISALVSPKIWPILSKPHTRTN